MAFILQCRVSQPRQVSNGLTRISRPTRMPTGILASGLSSGPLVRPGDHAGSQAS
jgi:hypothetical protein